MIYQFQKKFNSILLFSFFNISCLNMDVAEHWQLGFQDSATPIAEGIITLHHDLMFILIIVSFFVVWMLIRVLWLFHEKKKEKAYALIHGTQIEVLWTITPSFVLVFIAIPSFAL